ncbi:MAG: hypothetical protein WCT05_04300 [Lentisphaeria bacterium]
MLRIRVLLYAIAIGLSLQPLAAFEPGMPTVPWFDYVKKPMHLPADRGRLFCRELRQALLAGNTVEQIEQLAPDDANPRVLFISLGDGIWPERTYFGAGYTFSSALRQVLTILQNREPLYAEIITARLKKDIAVAGDAPIPSSWQEKLKNPGFWSDLRLDIVQSALPVEGFSIRHSKIQLTSLNGLAFRPADGLAFTAAQMMGRYLITPERYLNERQISELISESDNWDALKTWLQMANSAQEGRICLFEYDSYFASPASCKRLFRGHPTQTGAGDVNPLEIAEEAGERLLQNLLDNGTLKYFFPEWQHSRQGEREFLSCQAELALAFARLGKASGQEKYTQAAQKVTLGLLKTCKSSTGSKPYRYIVEDEELPVEEKQQDPRLLVNLHTNALVCLALLESGLAEKTDEYRLLCRDLVAFLTRQQQRNGSFVNVLIFPGMERPLEEFFSEEGKLETVALAALAIEAYSRLDKENEAILIKRYELALSFLLEQLSEEKDLRALPLSPWLVELLCRKSSPSQEYVMQAGRLAIAASLEVNKTPLFPDFFGVPRDFPSMTAAAEHTWIIAALSNWLLQRGEEKLATDFLADAWPIWVFQQQAILEEAAASSLPRPNLYYHLFRDHLEDFGFDLNGQTTQILSMLMITNCLKNVAGQKFPKQPAALEAWHQCWQMMDQHPFCLDRSLVQRSVEGGSLRHSVGTLERGQSVTVKAKGGRLVGGEPSVSGRVLERKSRSGKRK